jgi:hypothetical protein
LYGPPLSILSIRYLWSRSFVLEVSQGSCCNCPCARFFRVPTGSEFLCASFPSKVWRSICTRQTVDCYACCSINNRHGRVKKQDRDVVPKLFDLLVHGGWTTAIKLEQWHRKPANSGRASLFFQVEKSVGRRRTLRMPAATVCSVDCSSFPFDSSAQWLVVLCVCSTSWTVECRSVSIGGAVDNDVCC